MNVGPATLHTCHKLSMAAGLVREPLDSRMRSTLFVATAWESFWKLLPVKRAEIVTFLCVGAGNMDILLRAVPGSIPHQVFQRHQSALQAMEQKHQLAQPGKTDNEGASVETSQDLVECRDMPRCYNAACANVISQLVRSFSRGPFGKRSVDPCSGTTFVGYLGP